MIMKSLKYDDIGNLFNDPDSLLNYNAYLILYNESEKLLLENNGVEGRILTYMYYNYVYYDKCINYYTCSDSDTELNKEIYFDNTRFGSNSGNITYFPYDKFIKDAEKIKRINKDTSKFYNISTGTITIEDDTIYRQSELMMYALSFKYIVDNGYIISNYNHLYDISIVKDFFEMDNIKYKIYKNDFFKIKLSEVEEKLPLVFKNNINPNLRFEKIKTII